MSVTTLVLIRHAASDIGRGAGKVLCGCYDAPLTPLGRKQVQRLRDRLAVDPAASVLYASPLQRAAETAQAAPELEARLMASLREIDCGALDGKPLAEIQANHPDLWLRNTEQSDENFNWLGGESYREFRDRVLAAINAIADRHQGERVLVVTHAGVISQILGTLAGVSPAKWEAFRPGNASVTELQWAADSGIVCRFDDRSHLGPLAS